jgi:hypothetical protein
MFNGTNPSGKLFDVVDEDGAVLGSFDEIGDAVTCGRAAPWWHGQVNIRRDAGILARRHAANQAYMARRRLELDYAA